MPQHDQTSPVLAIERVRSIYRRAADKFGEHGVEPIDVALGAAYATHDLARRAGMDSAEAVEWLRSAADVMERHLLDQARPH